ncbi:MAG: DUF3822 family protein [Bacteroidota bacterium]
MIAADIQESNFNKNLTNGYDLSILLGMDSFIYSISDESRQVLALRAYSFEKAVSDFSRIITALQELLQQDKKLQLAYRKVRLGLVNKKSTLVPNPFFDENQKATYLDKVTRLSDSDLIKVDHLEPLAAKNVYLVNRDVIKLLRNQFPNLQLYHSFSSLLLGLRQNTEHSTGATLYGNVREQVLQLVYFDGKDLVFSNSFGFHSSKDFIYFVMNVYHQFKLSPEEVPFVISGQIVEDSEIYHLLYRYIRHLKIIELPAQFQIGQELAREPQHFYFDLFSLA